MPWAPVKPWVMTLVLASTRIGHVSGLLHGRDDLLGRVGQVVGGDDRQADFGQDLLAEVDIGAFEPHDQRHRQLHVVRRRDHALGDHVAAHDAAEDVDQDRLRRSGPTG